jgi:hypothetical protein
LKKFILFCLLFIFPLNFILTGCNPIDLDESTEKILTPGNNSIPIEGKWKITKSIIPSSVNKSKLEVDKLIGKTAEFSSSIAVVGDEICKNPRYKVKVVNSNSYFVYEYKLRSSDIGIKSDKVQILSVFNDNNLFYSFVKDKDNQIMLYLDGIFYCLSKISDNGDYVEDDGTNSNINNKLTNDSKVLRTGILLGLRYTKDSKYNIPGASEKEQVETEYRTLWISSNNKSLNDVYETNDLFVPRKNGFWKIGVKREVTDQYVQDNLFAYPIETQPLTKPLPWDNGKGFLSKTILFVGNDYVSTEWNGSGYIQSTDKSWRTDALKVLPIDNLNVTDGVKLTDLIGPSGKDILKESSENIYNSQSDQVKSSIEKTAREDSFAMVRRNGHWILRGRLNSSNSSQNNPYIDFNITTSPTSKFVTYDDLQLPWSSVKKAIPDAVDAYTSPNKDIALIIAKDTLYIYTLTNNELSKTPAEKYKLNSGESVVMAEWVLGSYVDKWQKSFERNDITKLNGN